MNRVSPSITQSSAYDTGCRQPLQVSTYLLCPKKAFALNLQVRGRSPFGNALWESTAAACHFHSIKIKPDSTSPQSHCGGQGAAHFSNSYSLSSCCRLTWAWWGCSQSSSWCCSSWVFFSASAFALVVTEPGLTLDLSSSCWCFLQCFSKVEILAYVRLHTKQWYGRSPLCVLMWSWRYEDLEKARLQTEQRWGSRTSWVFRCCLRDEACLKAFPQVEHLKFLSPDSRSWCETRWAEERKFFPHLLHL